MQQPTPEEYFNSLIKKGYNPGIAGDMARAYSIPKEKQCSRCNGTGNELLSMYRECQACKGDGVSNGNEGNFLD